MAERLQTPNLERQNLAYDYRLDCDEYDRLSKLEGLIPQEDYVQLFLNWQREKLINLETNIGERFNAQMFEVKYPTKGDRMMHPSREEFALDTVVRGQQHRLGDTQNLTHNRKRELAEILSFSAVESFFAQNPESEDNLINASPPGGNYLQNFIDIYNLENEENVKFIRMRRYAISTTLQDHLNIVQSLAGSSEEINRDEADIEIKSVVFKTSKTIEEILALYIPDQNTLGLEEYQKLKEAYHPWAINYIDAIIRGEPTGIIERNLRAGYKFADIYLGKDTDQTKSVSPSSVYSLQEITHIAPILGTQTIKEVRTGCGIQGGSSAKSWDLVYSSFVDSSLLSTALSPNSEDQYGTLEIHCEECGATYNRNPGRLEEKCRRCGGTRGITC